MSKKMSMIIPAIPVHPGEVLQEEFLDPSGITQVALAEHLGVPARRINEICRGRRSVSAQTAWLLSQALGTSPQFWLNLQSLYDLAVAQRDSKLTPVSRIISVNGNAAVAAKIQ
ncbi:MAG: HigA family addiction module antidote protein [Sedimentisphaerales bacterium]|nr:HigA family addiction module antidote protein [Sedimentisphaerales bacterium]